MTPLVLFVGFLGAGKTTLLRALIPELRMAGLDPSLILNDYQNAKVDAELFRDVASDIRPISGSCVCCGSREELIEQLENFPHREKSVMLVEANGTTDTPELVEHLTAHPRLRGYTLPIQIAVVDAKRWQKRFWHNELERVQVRTATHIFLSRRDEVKPDRLAAVEADLAKLAPQSMRLDAARFAEELVGLEAEMRLIERREWIVAIAKPGKLFSPVSSPTHSHSHSHFASAEFALPALIAKERLEVFLNALPPEVMRAKGIVRFQVEGPVFIFQKVEQSNTAQFVELRNPPADTAPLLIVVGPQLDVEALAASLSVLVG